MTKKQFLINAIAFAFAWAVLPILLACDKGCEEHDGVCACDIPAEKAQSVTDASVVSDEKPARHPEPAWQRGEVKADMPASTAFKDALADEAKARAEAEGKAKAGIK